MEYFKPVIGTMTYGAFRQASKPQDASESVIVADVASHAFRQRPRSDP
jgi:hypothetical protein